MAWQASTCIPPKCIPAFILCSTYLCSTLIHLFIFSFHLLNPFCCVFCLWVLWQHLSYLELLELIWNWLYWAFKLDWQNQTTHNTLNAVSLAYIYCPLFNFFANIQQVVLLHFYFITSPLNNTLAIILATWIKSFVFQVRVCSFWQNICKNISNQRSVQNREEIRWEDTSTQKVDQSPSGLSTVFSFLLLLWGKLLLKIAKALWACWFGIFWESLTH